MKSHKLQENVDWESCLDKYSEIATNFLQQYPQVVNNDKFPHEAGTITKAQLTAKVKAIRSKYRAAVDSGKKSGQGRVVYEHYNLCSEIWGGSPATSALPVGVETGNGAESPTDSGSSPAGSELASRPASPQAQSQDEPSGSGSQPAAVHNRRDLLQVGSFMTEI